MWYIENRIKIRCQIKRSNVISTENGTEDGTENIILENKNGKRNKTI